jgi:hypothetical protein
MGWIAVGEGTWVIVLVAFLILAGVVYGFYTRGGSGIEQRPIDAERGAPGAKGPSEVSGRDEGEGSPFDTHGTR